MIDNSLKNRLLNGDVVIGTWTVIPSPTLVEVFGKAGMDFIIIDHEHGPFNYETSENMIRAAECGGCTPLIRVPYNSSSDILRSLEIGAHGIVVPQIGNRDEALKALSSMKYHPEGDRGVSAFTRASDYYGISISDRTEKMNKTVLSVLLIESISAVDNLESILESGVVDVVYIGTYDLSQSLGMTGDIYNPEVIRLMEKCVSTIRSYGVAAGVLAQTGEDLKRWVDMGFQFIPYIVDCGIIYQSVNSEFNELRELISV